MTTPASAPSSPSATSTATANRTSPSRTRRASSYSRRSRPRRPPLSSNTATTPRLGLVRGPLMHRIDRREFFHDTGRLVAALSAAGLLGSRLTAAEETKAAKKPDAQDRLRVAVIGVRGRGMDHLGKGKGGYLDPRNNTVVTTICDVDEGVIGRAMTAVEKAQGKAPK